MSSAPGSFPAPGPDPVPAAPQDESTPVSAADVPASQWRRMHPVTPVIKGWKVFAAIIAFVVYNLSDALREADQMVEGGRWKVAVGVLVLGGLVGFVYSTLAWRRTKFALVADTVHLNTGVLFRQQRQAKLDRLQAVDVVQPLLARLFGLSELKLEVAGGAGSGVSLAFLREGEADALRAELLARAAGLHTTEHVAPAETAPEQAVYDVPMGRLLRSLVRSGMTLTLVVLLAAMGVAAVVARDVAPVFALAPALLGFGGVAWSTFNRGANFRAAISPDGIRLRHGLTEARAQTVPPGRVQAVRFMQGPLWRGSDWWRVDMNVAGYGGEDEQGTANVLLPVGTRDEALLALWLVLPDLGCEDPRALLDAGLSGTGSDGGFLTAPRRARWLDLVGWQRRGVVVTDRALVIRSGRLIRRLVVVPHERTQSLGIAQGPVQRRLRVASIEVHSTPGPVQPRIEHLDENVAAALLDEQAERARTARARALPEQWMRRQEEL